MQVSRTFKEIMAFKSVKQVHMAEILGYSKQSFNNFLVRDSWKIKDIEKAADILDCDVELVIVDRQTGKIYRCE